MAQVLEFQGNTVSSPEGGGDGVGGGRSALARTQAGQTAAEYPASSVSIHLTVEVQLRVFYKYIHKYFHKCR